MYAENVTKVSKFDIKKREREDKVMKNEKGEILELFAVAFSIIIIVSIFVIVGIIIKNNIEYGTKEGKVIDKNYIGAYTTIQNSGNITFPQYHPERYNIRIQKEEKGKIKSIWINVDQTTYHNINIGEYYGYHE